MADDSEDSINELQETVERTIPPKKAKVNDCEDSRCIIHGCNTEKRRSASFKNNCGKQN